MRLWHYNGCAGSGLEVLASWKIVESAKGAVDRSQMALYLVPILAAMYLFIVLICQQLLQVAFTHLGHLNECLDLDLFTSIRWQVESL